MVQCLFVLSGDPKYIVQAMENITQSLNYQLAWTPDNINCLLGNPRAEGNLNWTYCMPQLYTDSTQWAYSTSGCSPAKDVWSQIMNRTWTPFDPDPSDPYWKTHYVPMFCGAGNCQEQAGSIHQLGVCIDERLSPTVSADHR